jgi:hypothetical protein
MKYKYKTKLFLAAKLNETSILVDLINNNAETNIQDKLGNTALIYGKNKNYQKNLV